MNLDEPGSAALIDRAPKVGDTPISEVRMRINNLSYAVYLKLEGYNPAGSLKDRTASSLVTQLESSGLLHLGDTLVESTSGNLGVALAFIARAKGYKFVAVVDPKVTTENLTRMTKLGASIEMVEEADDHGNYLCSRLARVQALCASSPRYVWLNQYESPANPAAHYTGTAPELYRQMKGDVGLLLVAVSTGGTLAGVARYFRESSPSTRIVAVDAIGSVALGGQPGPRHLSGIGSTRRSSFVTPDMYDEVILIDSGEAFRFCRVLLADVGLKVGGSSGALLAACHRYLTLFPETTGNIVCLCPDRGENYDSSIFNDTWLRSVEVGDRLRSAVLPSAGIFSEPRWFSR